MFSKYVLVGTLIMHDSYFTKVTGGDKFYLGKTLITVAAPFCSNIRVGQWLEPRVTPEKCHIYISSQCDEVAIFVLLVLVNDLIHPIIGLL
jgi:hypothetical protein